MGSKRGQKGVILAHFDPVWSPLFDPLFGLPGPILPDFPLVDLAKGGAQKGPPNRAKPGLYKPAIQHPLKVTLFVCTGLQAYTHSRYDPQIAIFGPKKGVKKGSKRGHLGVIWGHLVPPF